MNIDIQQKKKKEYTLKIKLDDDEIKKIAYMDIRLKPKDYLSFSLQDEPLIFGYDYELNINNHLQSDLLFELIQKIKELAFEN